MSMYLLLDESEGRFWTFSVVSLTLPSRSP